MTAIPSFNELKYSDRVKKLPQMSPRMGDAFVPRLGVDEKLIFRLYLFGYRAIIYKIKRR